MKQQRAMKQQAVCVYLGEALGRYGFGGGHPFDAGRMRSFEEGAASAGVLPRVERREPAIADRATIERFHTSAYVERVMRQSKTGEGYLDYGDTPAFPGAYDAAAAVVGSTVDAVHRLMRGDFRRAFVPIAGLHHARRDRAGGFCVFNDCGVAIEVLKADYRLGSIAYVDIDAHHGDGVYYDFEDDPAVVYADLHEDGRFLYPGTGAAEETGRGPALGTKLNIPMPPYSDEAAFRSAWPRVEAHIEAHLAKQSRASSCSSAGPTVWPGTRSPTCSIPRRATPMRRHACARWPIATARAESSAWAAAGTITTTSPRPGAACYAHLSRPVRF